MDTEQHTVLCWIFQAKQDWLKAVIKKVICGKSSFVVKGYACLEHVSKHKVISSSVVVFSRLSFLMGSKVDIQTVPKPVVLK